MLTKRYPNFKNYSIDIRDYDEVLKIFNEYSTDIGLVVHAAAQPSHDWAAKDPSLIFQSMPPAR